MRIDFHKLIKQSGEKLTKADLAREMVAKGIFRNQVSALVNFSPDCLISL